MIIRNEADISAVVRSDTGMMRVLAAAESLQLPDWWIGAGFLRNRIWDALSGNEPEVPRDIDLVYFNAADVRHETDWSYDEQMKRDFPFAKWEIRNQARMHYKSNSAPFTSTTDGIAYWPETATSVAVRLEDAELKFLFCYGLDDLLGLIARPTPYFQQPDLLEEFHRRIATKGWRQRWPSLRNRNR